eukprot:361653-Chlamydomonas_euryale.AAC.2
MLAAARIRCGESMRVHSMTQMHARPTVFATMTAGAGTHAGGGSAHALPHADEPPINTALSGSGTSCDIPAGGSPQDCGDGGQSHADGSAAGGGRPRTAADGGNGGSSGSGGGGGGGDGSGGSGSGGGDGTHDDELDALMRGYEAEAEALACAAARRGARGGTRGCGRGHGQLPGMVKGREAAMATPLPASNKGFQLLTRMGYQPGQGVGKSVIGRVEPLAPEGGGQRCRAGDPRYVVQLASAHTFAQKQWRSRLGCAAEGILPSHCGSMCGRGHPAITFFLVLWHRLCHHILINVRHGYAITF